MARQLHVMRNKARISQRVGKLQQGGKEILGICRALDLLSKELPFYYFIQRLLFPEGGAKKR